MRKKTGYYIKGKWVEERQYFYLTKDGMTSPVHFIDGMAVHGETQKTRVRDFVTVSKGQIYAGTNGGKLNISVDDINADPDAEVEVTEDFCPQYLSY
ncbi:MAG: hypothetical protein LBN36_04670 [Clostridiales Family XIII bacterium]|nr:hypothetical protein [Clostridiales Family XIII bacterium]